MKTASLVSCLWWCMGPRKMQKFCRSGWGSPRRKKEKKREKREKSREKRRFQTPPKKKHEGKKANSLFVWSVGIVKLSCKPKRIIITPDNSEIGALRITNKQTIWALEGVPELHWACSGLVCRSPFFFFFRNRLWMLTMLCALFPHPSMMTHQSVGELNNDEIHGPLKKHEKKQFDWKMGKCGFHRSDPKKTSGLEK